ncbi:MAG: helix-turn-helix domain-containing protein [Armatimonadota bacterium]|nr:helix-turn-helix domain-containing protein [Armatimonadota bacterium]MDR7444647.1 helix-turn-helix domain-containing protein [Armatimonadota bacterium]MDR7569473.1 helix-turn-helix domain-containing protein [Armatimonadota bacterium]MDR7613644.1 helix-turn-helix domain-containing protein [Armatimonadota bacterium]
MSDILHMAVEIVKTQAAQREMSAAEIAEYLQRTVHALQTALHGIGAPEKAAPAGEAAPQEGLETAPAAPRTLRVEEAAKYLGRTPMTVYKYIHQGKLPAQRVGRSFLIRLEDAQALKQELGRTGRRSPRRAAGARPRRRVASRAAAGRRRGTRKA